MTLIEQTKFKIPLRKKDIQGMISEAKAKLDKWTSTFDPPLSLHDGLSLKSFVENKTAVFLTYTVIRDRYREDRLTPEQQTALKIKQ